MPIRVRKIYGFFSDIVNLVNFQSAC